MNKEVQDLHGWHPIPGSQLGWFYVGGGIQYATLTGYRSGGNWTAEVNRKLETAARGLRGKPAQTQTQSH